VGVFVTSCDRAPVFNIYSPVSDAEKRKREQGETTAPDEKPKAEEKKKTEESKPENEKKTEEAKKSEAKNEDKKPKGNLHGKVLSSK